MISDHVITIVAADGDHMIAVDQPTSWAHNLTNTGDQTRYTFFWSNYIFEPSNPHMYAERA